MTEQAQYRAGWMIWFAGLNTIGVKSGQWWMVGSHLPMFRTTKSGSRFCVTHCGLRLQVQASIAFFGPTTALSVPLFTTRHSQGMFRNAK